MDLKMVKDKYIRKYNYIEADNHWDKKLDKMGHRSYLVVGIRKYESKIIEECVVLKAIGYRNEWTWSMISFDKERHNKSIAKFMDEHSRCKFFAIVLTPLNLEFSLH
jgi:hypothetical protein